MTVERTLILLKPDSLQRAFVGEIISRFERKSLKLVAIKMLKMTPALSKEHYAHIVSKPFYPEIEQFMTSTAIIAMVIEGEQAVDVVRLLLGPTDSNKALPGTIRGDLSNSIAKNMIHASDSKETAEKEVHRFFKKEELF
ncbi:MAG: nucleoside-diphosphate kinase [Candidatus Micrarchaeota archaeon]|nr:nucleoside-diphosphate kinase [Candidatus Micrarchaeota archaeon]